MLRAYVPHRMPHASSRRSFGITQQASPMDDSFRCNRPLRRSSISAQQHTHIRFSFSYSLHPSRVRTARAADARGASCGTIDIPRGCDEALGEEAALQGELLHTQLHLTHARLAPVQCGRARGGRRRSRDETRRSAGEWGILPCALPCPCLSHMLTLQPPPTTAPKATPVFAVGRVDGWGLGEGGGGR